MYKKIFQTFVTTNNNLEKEIEKWLKEINGREINRSSPTVTFIPPDVHNNGRLVVAVTSTAEVYTGE